jgi:hypothetical protein
MAEYVINHSETYVEASPNTQGPIVSLSELQAMYEAKVGAEVADKQHLCEFMNFDQEKILASLKQWALVGFPDGHPIQVVNLPTADRICIDGQTRDIQQYILYLTGKTVRVEIETLSARLPGIRTALIYFSNSLQIQVWKD